MVFLSMELVQSKHSGWGDIDVHGSVFAVCVLTMGLCSVYVLLLLCYCVVAAQAGRGR